MSLVRHSKKIGQPYYRRTQYISRARAIAFRLSSTSRLAGLSPTLPRLITPHPTDTRRVARLR